MRTFLQLTQAFYRAYPHLIHQPPPPLQASCDLAVAQFPNHLNAVGFLALHSCPGATPACLACCYTEGGQAGMPIAKAVRARNTHTLLQRCQKNAVRQLTAEFVRLMDVAHHQYLRRLRRARDVPLRRLQRGALFRFQWSGDLVHPTHAQAVYRATSARPQLQCWLYTRSFHLLPYLEPPLKNLTVWLSEDRDNQPAAREAWQRFPWARLATLVKADEGPPGALVCPKLVLTHDQQPKLPTANACARCRLCPAPPTKVRQIFFPEKYYANFHPLTIQDA